jgi:MFS family permease
MLHRSKQLIFKWTPKAFGNRVFLRVWLVNLISATAVAAHDTAATWMMNLMSPCGIFISLMASLASLPFFLLTLPAGAMADALNEARIMRVTNLWLAACAGTLALLALAGMLNPILLLCGVFLLGAGFAINAPAWASTVPQIVNDDELPSASALNGMQLNVSGVLGPALAGVLLTKVGVPVVFGLNAIGFLLVSAAIPPLQKTGLSLGQTLRTFASSISDALRYVSKTNELQNILVRNAIFSLFVVVIPALTPVLLLKELCLDGSSLGLVFASLGVGSVAGAIYVLPRLRSRFSSDGLIIIAQIVLSGIYLLISMVNHSAYCLLPMGLAGASWTVAGAELWVMAQRAMPNSNRGRVSAIMMMGSQGAMILGGMIWGFSGQLAGTRPTLFAASFLLFAVTVAGWLVIRAPAKSIATKSRRQLALPAI